MVSWFIWMHGLDFNIVNFYTIRFWATFFRIFPRWFWVSHRTMLYLKKINKFRSHKHALTVELVGLKLQPDCIIIDNALTCPLSFLIPFLFIKIGAYFKNPGIGFKIAALFCFIK